MCTGIEYCTFRAVKENFVRNRHVTCRFFINSAFVYTVFVTVYNISATHILLS